LLGQLTGAVGNFVNLKRDKGYTVCFASQWPFSFVPVVVALLIPESPTYLVRKNRIAQALKSQGRLAAVGSDPQATIAKIQADIQHELSLKSRTSYRQCFQGTNVRRSWIIVFVNLLPNAFGLTLLAKASYFMQIVGMGAFNSVLFLILGIVLGLFSNFASIWVTARFGRRLLIVNTLAVAAVLWGGMGIAGCWRGIATVWYVGNSTSQLLLKEIRTNIVSRRYTAITMMIVIIVCSLGVWPASFAVSSETSSLHLRAKSQGIGWFTSGAATSAWGVALPYMFNPDQGNLRAKTGFVFAATCALAVLVAWWCVPEMKGRSPAEIDRLFELKVPARSFEGYEVDDDAAAEGKGTGREERKLGV
jgi:hypothetical protein